MKLVAAGAPAPKPRPVRPAARRSRSDARPPPRSRSRKPVSSPALRARLPCHRPALDGASAGRARPDSGTAPEASEPAEPLMKRAINGKFVALIIGLVLVAAGVVAGLLWSKKAKIEAQAAVDEDP